MPTARKSTTATPRKRRTRKAPINRTAAKKQMEVVITPDHITLNKQIKRLDTFTLVILPFLYLEAFVKLILRVK